MSWNLLAAVDTCTAKKPRDCAVLRILAGRANAQSECWPSVRSIASDTRLCERTVQLALRSLEQAGHITVKENARGGAHHATPRYCVHPVPCPERMAGKEARHRQRGDDQATAGTGANASPVEFEEGQRDTPRVNELHSTGANAAPHGRSGCTQTLRETKREPSPNLQQKGGVVDVSLSLSQQKKRDRAGPVPLETVLEFCRGEGIDDSAGNACWHEWQENDWCIKGERIHDWRALLRDRWKRRKLPAAGEMDCGAPDSTAQKWQEEPKGDWRAILMDRYGMESEWGALIPEVQKELITALKEQRERDSWPAEEVHLLCFSPVSDTHLTLPTTPYL